MSRAWRRLRDVIVDVRGGRRTAIEDRLRELGVRRPACVRVRHHTAAAPAVPGTTLIATLPWRIAAGYAGIRPSGSSMRRSSSRCTP